MNIIRKVNENTLNLRYREKNGTCKNGSMINCTYMRETIERGIEYTNIYYRTKSKPI